MTESQVDLALTNAFTTLMRLGWFDEDPTKQSFGNLGLKDVCTEANQELGLDAARQKIALLENTIAFPLAKNRI
ncbi:hypothetical protein SUGI_0681230 [Cryptomeria japonica]|nr:hypothetical protein SUGI_0681230 [Cryptomeria japonica]